MSAAKKILPFFLLCIFFTASGNEPKRWHYEIVRTLPHSTDHFTQGLVMRDGRLFESTGRYGHSTLSELDPQSGKVLHTQALQSEYFGEGLTLLRGQLFQLSWQNRLGFIYNRELEPAGTFSYSTEGWGLTDDGERLILSDGTDTLYWIDAEHFNVARRLSVRSNGQALTRLNELEYVNGRIFANIWLTPYIAVIAADSGQVVSWLDLSGLMKQFEKPENWNALDHVLNGIAYDAKNDVFYVTGKCWPLIFVLKLKQQ